MTIIEMIIEKINYIGAIALFIIGLRIVVLHSNLIKRIMGINVMGTGVFLFFVAIGNVTGGAAPIIGDNPTTYINPLPSVFILTGIVVVVSITVYSLSLIIRIYENYNTIDQKELSRLISEEERND